MSGDLNFTNIQRDKKSTQQIFKAKIKHPMIPKNIIIATIHPDVVLL